MHDARRAAGGAPDLSPKRPAGQPDTDGTSTNIDVPAASAPPTRAEGSVTRWRAASFSFIAGYVDTCVFIALFGLFTAHVTGNLVLIGSELVHRNGDVYPKVLAFAAFVVAVVAAVLVDRALRVRGPPRVATFLGIEAALLLLTIAATGGGLPDSASTVPALVAGSLAAAAMGVQNAMMRLELPHLPSTTVMTVNVTQAVIDATAFVLAAKTHEDAAKLAEARKRFARMGPQIASFTAGCATGALGFELVGLPALLLPAAWCAALAFQLARESRS